MRVLFDQQHGKTARAIELANVVLQLLKIHLARHKLSVGIVRTNADRADIQPTILSIAADTGLDLIPKLLIENPVMMMV